MTRDGSWDAVMSAEVVTITFAASFANSVTIFLLTFFGDCNFLHVPVEGTFFYTRVQKMDFNFLSAGNCYDHIDT
jgi:hypothetical protein